MTQRGWIEPCSVQMGGKLYDCDALSYVIDAELVLRGMQALIQNEIEYDEFKDMLDKFEGYGRELREELACQL